MARPWATALVAVALWASAFVGIRDAVGVYRPEHLALLRFLCASAAFAVLAVAGRIRLPAVADLARLAASGAIGIALYHLCLNAGAREITAGSASFLTNTVPVWTALLAAAFLRESIAPRSWLGIGVAFAGTSVLGWGESGGPGSAQAVALVLAAALAQAVYFVLQKPLLRRYRPLEAVAYAVWSGTLCLLLFGGGLRAAVAEAPVTATAVVVYLGVGPGALSYVLWARFLATAPAGRATSLLFLVPLFTLTIGWFWLREVPSRAALAGGAVTLVGVALAQAGASRGPRASTPGREDQGSSHGSAPMPERSIASCRRFPMSQFAADLVVAFRRMRRAPGSALFAAAVLALGVGAATALFALVRGIVLRPLPYADPDRLVVLVEDTTNAKGWPTSVGRLGDYNARGQVFAGGLAAWRGADGVLTAAGSAAGAERIPGARITGNAFALLGLPAQRGRWLVDSDEHPDAPPVAVISEGLWRRRFAGDEAIVGRSLDLDGSKRTIVGVAPRGFAWPRPATEFWIPFVPTEAERNRGFYAMRTVGRLRPGATIEAAGAELVAVATGLDKEFPDTEFGTRPRLVPMLEEVLGSTGSALGLLQGAVLVVLLVATANFANLLLARGAAREGELAVRAALGGDRRSLVRLQLAEALGLGVFGAFLGLGLGAAALRVALSTGAASLPRAAEVRIDWAVATLAVSAALFAAVLAALVPAMLSSGRPAADALRGAGKGSGLQRRRRALATLVVVEIAAATTLAAGSGLLLRSVARLTATESGVDPTGVVTLEIGQPAGVSTIAEMAAYYRRLIERLSETPGFDAVSVISRLPVVGLPATTNFEIEGRPNLPGKGPVADHRYVEPGALPLLGVPFLAGRDLLPNDGGEAPSVVLVNRAFVASQFLDGEAVGKRLWIGNERGGWRTIVGVVADVHLSDLEKPVDPTLWISFPQATFPAVLRTVSVVVKSRLAPGDALQRARGTIASFDAFQAPTKPRPLAEAIAGSLEPRRFQAGLFAAFALIAGALAAAGVYGVTAYSVAQRRDEFGVRLALGADARALACLVLGQAARLGGLGVLAGVVVALTSGRLVVRWLYGVRSWDPPVLGAVILLLGATALLASLLPALRAARTAPAQAMRGE